MSGNLASVFRQWNRKARDKALGRISFDPNRFVFAENAPPLASDESEWSRHPSRDANGRDMVFIRGRATWCKHPKWDGVYPLSKNGNYSVPYGACTKCPFYAKSTKRIRFSRCLWVAKAQTEPEARVAAAHDMLNLVVEAEARAQQMIGHQKANEDIANGKQNS